MVLVKSTVPQYSVDSSRCIQGPGLLVKVTKCCLRSLKCQYCYAGHLHSGANGFEYWRQGCTTSSTAEKTEDTESNAVQDIAALRDDYQSVTRSVSNLVFLSTEVSSFAHIQRNASMQD